MVYKVIAYSNCRLIVNSFLCLSLCPLWFKMPEFVNNLGQPKSYRIHRVTALALAATATSAKASTAKVTSRLETRATKPMKAGPVRMPL